VLTGFRDPMEPAGGVEAGALSLPGLARLLHFSNGVTGPNGLRAAPSAGALYAGEMYVVAERVIGIPPGVYYYSPRERALVLVRSGSAMDAVGECVERPSEVDNAHAVVLLTNVFRRYGWRYANRGYRYALIDTGHIGENLRLVARSSAFADLAPSRFWDDRLNDLLGVDGSAEAVCALHILGRPFGEPSSARPSRVLVPVGSQPTTGKPTVRYHRGSRLEPGEGRAARDARDLVPALAIQGLRPTASVEECVRRRRSAMRFRDQPIGRDQLEWILDAGWSRSTSVQLALAIHRVRATPPGFYRIDSARGLMVTRAGDVRARLVETCLGQDKAGSCAAALFMVAPLRDAHQEAGTRSYRDLLIEAGAIGQRIYLAAEAVGLAARNLASFRDDELNDLLGLDGVERAVVHMTLVGQEG
jgi:SagB-type dehydrogenase family enzyme